MVSPLNFSNDKLINNIYILGNTTFWASRKAKLESRCSKVEIEFSRWQYPE